MVRRWRQHNSWRGKYEKKMAGQALNYGAERVDLIKVHSIRSRCARVSMCYVRACVGGKGSSDPRRGWNNFQTFPIIRKLISGRPAANAVRYFGSNFFALLHLVWCYTQRSMLSPGNLYWIVAPKWIALIVSDFQFESFLPVCLFIYFLEICFWEIKSWMLCSKRWHRLSLARSIDEQRVMLIVRLP